MRLCTHVTIVANSNSVLFFISALVQLALGRLHKKEKRFGPSPANGYTRGSGVKFFSRRKRNRGGLRDPEMAAGALAPAGHDVRPSHDTAYTGSTVAGNGVYENTHKPLTGGYHTAPTGTATYPTHTPATNY